MTLSLQSKKGFTLIETIITVGIIAVLTTLMLISFRSARVSSRDTKRISDFNTMAAALSMYYQQNGVYPTAITSGAPLVSPNGQTVYLSETPANARPYNDNGCPDSGYTYTVSAANKWFEAVSCIGHGESGSEIITLTPAGLTKTPNAKYAWWKFDEGSGTTVDDSGNLGAGLTLTGSSSWGSGTDCKQGNCYLFNGSDTVASLTLPSLSSYTIMGWVKRLSDQPIVPSDEYQIFDSANDAVGLSIWYDKGNGNTPYFNFFNGPVIRSATVPAVGTYYHVAATSDGSTRKLYINGVLEGSKPAGNSLAAGTATIGAFNTGTDRLIDAAIDNFRIYDRALSQKEIQNIYNSEN